jgi:hypothetical protein
MLFCIPDPSNVYSAPFVLSSSRCIVVFSMSRKTVFPVSCYFCNAGHPHSGGGQLLRDPQFPQVRIFLTKFPLRRATAERRDTFLQVAVNFLRDPQSPRVSSFGFSRRPAGKFRALCRFFRPLTGFITALPSNGHYLHSHRLSTGL